MQALKFAYSRCKLLNLLKIRKKRLDFSLNTWYNVVKLEEKELKFLKHYADNKDKHLKGDKYES